MGGGSDPVKIKMKKINFHFLEDMCGWIWSLEKKRVGSSKTIKERKSEFIVLTIFADRFGSLGEWIWSP